MFCSYLWSNSSYKRCKRPCHGVKFIFLVLAKLLLDISNIFGIFWGICNAGLLPLVLETKLSWMNPKPAEKDVRHKARNHRQPCTRIGWWAVRQDWPSSPCWEGSSDEEVSCRAGHGSDMTQAPPVFWASLAGQLPVTAVIQPRERAGLVHLTLCFFFMFWQRKENVFLDFFISLL